MRSAVSLNALQTFVRHDLRLRLRKDLRNLKIVKEADLECASYYHLRRFISSDDRWRILARKHAQQTGHFIDLLIFKNARPRIAIELKWRRKAISRKDLRSLRASLKKLSVNKAYFVCAIPNESQYKKLRKSVRDKYLLHECVVGLNWTPTQVQVWEQLRRHFTKEMRSGKAKH
jgi:hypothetical protein